MNTNYSYRAETNNTAMIVDTSSNLATVYICGCNFYIIFSMRG